MSTAAAILRWTAHAWGAASSVLLLAFAFGGREHLRFTGGEALAFLLFPIGVIVGFVVAWWRGLVGGLITVGSLALFYLYAFVGGSKWVGPYFILFAAPGFLHIASVLLAKRKPK